jgi:hypothetical protein
MESGQGRNRSNNRTMKTGIAMLFTGLLFAFGLDASLAGPPILVDRQTGKYLGNLSANPYDPNSTSNPHGRYGSEYSQDSINNPHGRYGSPYSQDSANNPYATNPPAIIDPSSTSLGQEPVSGF